MVDITGIVRTKLRLLIPYLSRCLSSPSVSALCSTSRNKLGFGSAAMRPSRRLVASLLLALGVLFLLLVPMFLGWLLSRDEVLRVSVLLLAVAVVVVGVWVLVDDV